MIPGQALPRARQERGSFCDTRCRSVSDGARQLRHERLDRGGGRRRRHDRDRHQGAITAYTLVMAMFMIPGGKGRGADRPRRAFMIGCCIYGCSTTALAPNLAVLLVGWSLLEGIGRASSCPRSWRSWPATSPLNYVPPPMDSSRPQVPWRSRSDRSSEVSQRRTFPGDGCSPVRSWWVTGILLLARRLADVSSGTSAHRSRRHCAVRARDLGLSSTVCSARTNGAGSGRSPMRRRGSVPGRSCG